MEPCLFRHGKRVHPADLPVRIDASMEPCLFRHGKREMRARTISLIPLQWSHVFSDMVRHAGI